MSRAPKSTNAITRVEPGSDQDRVARALYEHDALRAATPWHSWNDATRPKKLLYLDRATTVIATLRCEVTVGASCAAPASRSQP